jgi:hypothetical protein
VSCEVPLPGDRGALSGSAESRSSNPRCPTPSRTTSIVQGSACGEPVRNIGARRSSIPGLRCDSSFDAGEYYCDASYSSLGEAVVNYLERVGIRTQLRPLERAAFFAQYREKKLSHIVQIGSGAFGNAATGIEAFVAAGGAYVAHSRSRSGPSGTRIAEGCASSADSAPPAAVAID